MAAAEAFFKEAKVLLAQKDYAKACPKLEESQRLDPGGGTLLLLASCYEAEGKLASAWAAYIEVVALSRQSGRADRERIAKARVDALGPRLSYMTIELDTATARLVNVDVKRDGTALSRNSWSVKIPVDAGTHSVQIAAPGYTPLTLTVAVEESSAKVVNVPSLVPLTTAVQPAPATVVRPKEGTKPELSTPPLRPTNTQRTIGWIASAVGTASLGVGVFFGLKELGTASEVKIRCPASPCTDMAARGLHDVAQTQALVANIAVGIGIVSLGSGLWLLLTAPSKPSPQTTKGTLTVAPVLSSTVSGVVLRARW
jgi:hypothetical protein